MICSSVHNFMVICPTTTNLKFDHRPDPNNISIKFYMMYVIVVELLSQIQTYTQLHIHTDKMKIIPAFT